jgi:acetamidase/formamidase
MMQKQRHVYLPANADTIHWGYFSRELSAKATIGSGDLATIEVLTHHANDDPERMVRGDAGAESVFGWTDSIKNVDRRGAGKSAGGTSAGTGDGLGVHICTGPLYIEGAQPGDILEVRILDVRPRASCAPAHQGKTFGSNAAANWGHHYHDLLHDAAPREVVTIYELDASGHRNWASAVYSYRWTPQTDPYGVVHNTIDYPGIPVDPATIEKNFDVLKGVRVPIRPHFGVIAVAPAEQDMLSTIPPSYFGGNIDNWRVGKGATIYLPVSVPGALFSVGDSHASQGDSELCGTAIECSLTGTFQFIVHPKAESRNTFLDGLKYPLIETDDEWVVTGFSQPDYLRELGESAPSKIFETSTLDSAMRDAFRKMRSFLMTHYGLTEDEAISLMSVAVDFGVTQVVDGNLGVHAVVKKSIFPS